VTCWAGCTVSLSQRHSLMSIASCCLPFGVDRVYQSRNFGIFHVILPEGIGRGSNALPICSPANVFPIRQITKTANPAYLLQGIQKVVLGTMMRTLGLTYTKAMNPKLTKIVVSTDVTDTASAKVNAAKE